MIMYVFFLCDVVVAIITTLTSTSETSIDLRADIGNETIFKVSDLPQPMTCGPYEIPHRIFGGDVAEITEFPWMALIEHTRRENTILLQLK